MLVFNQMTLVWWDTDLIQDWGPDLELDQTQGEKVSLKVVLLKSQNNLILVMNVKWATVQLGTKEEIEFSNVAFYQYILGEIQILNHASISEAKWPTRMHFMKRISKLYQKLGFNKSKELYKETLNAIENGEFTWCKIYEIERLENINIR